MGIISSHYAQLRGRARDERQKSCLEVALAVTPFQKAPRE